MYSPLTMMLVITGYMALLFALAQWVERRIARQSLGASQPWLYALSLAVFHTSWTFYGSVGFASESGPLYLAIYVGALLGVLAGWFTLRRMILAKETFHITSIADLIANRYNRSGLLAALVTLIALVGIVPYIALQLTAIVNSVQILTQQSTGTAAWGIHGLLVTALVLGFIIVIGMRRLDPTERHPGMICALVAECVVKLAAALIVGAFINWSLFDGVDDILSQLPNRGFGHLLDPTGAEHSGMRWLTLIILGFVGIQLLPRQFHVAVVENASRQHLKTALWLFPLYMVLINLFVIPVAGAGLLSGMPLEDADYFMLLLPQQAGADLITLIGFIGSFSAATGMILITTVALATMVTNHLLLPLIEQLDSLSDLRHNLLQVRWASATGVIAASYLFALEFSDSYILVSIGLLSFTAILQLAPATLIGLFWRGGNHTGALAGTLLGFAVWAWTLAVPAFISQGWFNEAVMEHGPWGVEMLRPHALFGLEGLPDVVHTTFWSLLLNTLGYLLGSAFYHSDKQQRTQTAEFMNAVESGRRHKKARPIGLDAYIEFSPKVAEAEELLASYLNEQAAQIALQNILDDLQVSEQHQITIIELIEFHRMLEHKLAGSIGSASAHHAIENGISYSNRESSDLKALYSHIVCDINAHKKRQHQAMEQETNLNLLEELQSQLNRLQTTARDQEEQIARLEQRLEASYDESFNYRLESQRLQQENRQLKQQLSRRFEDNSG